mgnify:CR=1 FL=1
MTTRTIPYNASEARTLTKYRIEVKRNGRWTPVRFGGKIIPFDTKDEAEVRRAGLKC